MTAEKRDIVIFSLLRYDGPYSSSSVALAKELSKHHRVFYINHPYSFKDVISEWGSQKMLRRIPALLFGRKQYTTWKTANGSAEVIMVTPPATLPVNFLPAGRLYNFFQRINDRVFFRCVRRLIKDRQLKDFIYINTYDPYFGLHFPEDIRPSITIYQCVDDMEEASYTNKHGARREKVFMHTYDLTLTTSKELYRLNKAHARNIEYLPNAADPALFCKAYHEVLAQPKEFSGITKKVIGYVGNIEQRLDYELVKKIADVHSDKLLFLIGPLSSDEYKAWRLDEVPNIIFTGGKQLEDLPAYLQNIDCAIIPFRCNKLTRSIYPLKINEYLAAGKPVVTTNFSEAIQDFSKVIYLAKDHDEFLSLIDRAIAEDEREKAAERLSVAARNSWTSRVDDFWDIVKKFEAPAK